jgi:hypothetical protein
VLEHAQWGCVHHVPAVPHHLPPDCGHLMGSKVSVISLRQRQSTPYPRATTHRVACWPLVVAWVHTTPHARCLYNTGFITTATSHSDSDSDVHTRHTRLRLRRHMSYGCHMSHVRSCHIHVTYPKSWRVVVPAAPTSGHARTLPISSQRSLRDDRPCDR